MLPYPSNGHIYVYQDFTVHTIPLVFQSDYGKIAATCNMWRNFVDVTDSWPSVLSIVDYYGDNKGNFSAFAKPGAWNDPDMVSDVIHNVCNNHDKKQ